MILLSNIGDAVMTTPVLERLHQLYPQAVIDIVGDRRSSEIFRHCPYKGTTFHKEKGKGWRGIITLVKQLRKTRYDLVVDLRTDGLGYLLRYRKQLMKWGAKPHGPHAVQQLIAIIDPINPDRTIPPCKLWLSGQEHEMAQQLVPQLNDRRWLVIGPGANFPGKIWPKEHFAQLLNALGNNINGVILLGSANDRQHAHYIETHVDIDCINLCGTTDLLTAAAILQSARLFIGNDSGLGHIASAVDTPTITLFGIGEPDRYHPWGNKSEWITDPDRSIENISPESVSALTSQLLDRHIST